MGSNDPNYGTVGWEPRIDGVPFACIYTLGVTDKDTIETNRIWSTYKFDIFIALDHADTASVQEDYHLITVGYIEQARQVIAANRRLLPTSLFLYPVSGDVQWIMTGAEIMERHTVLGVPYYGAIIHTTLRLINAVNYQG
jgi:hypothetical protein